MRRLDSAPNRGEAQRGVSVVLTFPEPRGGHFGDGEINLWGGALQDWAIILLNRIYLGSRLDGRKFERWSIP